MKKHLLNVYRKCNQEDKVNFKYVLTQNERNYPIPNELLNQFLGSINQKDLTFYPNTEKLKSKICDYYEIEIDNLLLTPGSTFAIKTIFESFDLKNNNVVTSDYCFPMYQVFCDLYQAKLKKATKVIEGLLNLTQTLAETPTGVADPIVKTTNNFKEEKTDKNYYGYH